MVTHQQGEATGILCASVRVRRTKLALASRTLFLTFLVTLGGSSGSTIV